MCNTVACCYTVVVCTEANQAADAMFRDILRRKERADATRNALGALQRFKFLFNLPCTLERNIKKVRCNIRDKTIVVYGDQFNFYLRIYVCSG